MLALATPYGTDLGPDDTITKKFSDTTKWDLRQDPTQGYSVAFQAGTNVLGLQTASMVSAAIKSQHGEATPMIVLEVGYPAVQWVWHDVPAGSYALTATVTNASGLATASAPVNVTVLP